MAIAYDTSAVATASANTITTSYTVGAGSAALLIVGIVSNINADTISTLPTYNGVTMSFAGSHTIASSQANTLFFYYLNNPTQSSAQNIVASVVSGTKMKLYAASYLGAGTISSANFASTDTGGSPTTITQSITTVSNNSWVVSLGGQEAVSATGAVTAGTGITLRQSSTNTLTVDGSAHTLSDAFGDSNGAVTPAGSYSVTWNLAANRENANIILLEIPKFGYTLTMAKGSYTLTGQNVLFSYGRKLVMATGSYTLTGFSLLFTLFQKWINGIKNISTQVNQSKNSSSWGNDSKNTSTQVNQSKTSSTWVNGNKNSSSINNQTKN
jgi:hypothetical protein